MTSVTSTFAFPEILKSWRQKRRWSQLELALSSGVSQRHVSFLESGRARPSRSMVMQLSETLEVPLRQRNGWLTAAGFAPVFPASALDDARMAQVMAAVRMMLDNHAPYPAVAMDRAWNVRMANEPFEALAAMFGADLFARVGGRNLLRVCFHPLGIRPYVTNWAAIGPLLWQRANREAEALGGMELAEVLGDLRPLQDSMSLRMEEDTVLVPVLPLELMAGGRRLALFTVIATFGTPQDVTTDELRVELFFPADAATAGAFGGA
jgi:transcriptional regulator with XRE-family HTH domain